MENERDRNTISNVHKRVYLHRIVNCHCRMQFGFTKCFVLCTKTIQITSRGKCYALKKYVLTYNGCLSSSFVKYYVVLLYHYKIVSTTFMKRLLKLCLYLAFEMQSQRYSEFQSEIELKLVEKINCFCPCFRKLCCSSF